MAAHAINDPASGGGSFQADPGRLAVLAADFAGFAERAEDISTRLRAALVDRPWGTDEAGQRFADEHTGPVADTLDRIDTIEAGLAETGETLAVAAAAYRDADGSAAIEVADIVGAAEGGMKKPGDPGRAG
ncbi:hypothetical protein BAY61_03795 [Prauserella marina]|uniref:Uncharacterized protein n=1 Tax=Prauserella marina TaxID=530584 RepID=A0A222VK08_9PSEU|nr:hypothetical protein [Prauserella marina]ASR34260.1 hypothetical protein BAY61_03795 [Prauserella marina]PWV71974.1 hypothetical protein DES30_111145 [Prauserella marina]SDD92296.1 hypothetical protein SAMN05421630_114144 [Prauserella marina]